MKTLLSASWKIYVQLDNYLNKVVLRILFFFKPFFSVMPKKFCLIYEEELKDSSFPSQKKWNFSFVLSLSSIFLSFFINFYI